MSNYQELLAQKAELDKQIEAMRKTEIQTAVNMARQLIEEFDLTVDDLFGTSRVQSKMSGTKVAPKYRNPGTGETWTGRGKAPLWIARAEDRDLYLITDGAKKTEAAQAEMSI